MFLSILIALAAIFFYVEYIKPTLHWRSKGIPYEPSWPLIGSMAPVAFRKMHLTELLRKWYKKHMSKRYFGVLQFTSPTLIINDLELIKEITVKQFDSFSDHAEFVPRDSDPFWNNTLFTMEGPKWKEMRSVVRPVFTSGKIKMIFNLMLECSNTLLSHLDSTKGVLEVEMRNLFRQYANDVIASTVFGLRLDTIGNPDNEFYKLGSTSFSFEGMKRYKFFAQSISPTLSKLFSIKLIDDYTRNFFVKLVNDTISQREEKGYVRLDLLHLLREAQKKRASIQESEKKFIKQNITNEDIAAQATAFYFGGFDTVSVTLSYVAYELALHPKVQKRLIEEIDKTLENYDNKITYDALSNLPYMDMVVSETFRLWGSNPFLNRKVTKEFTIQPESKDEVPLTVETGTVIWIPTSAIHRDPRYFENPEQFDPERFSEENRNDINPFTFLPFGAGPRLCIGNRYALLKMKTIMFHILKKFEIVPTSRTSKKITPSKTNVMLINRDGFWMGLKPREVVGQ